MQENQAGRTVGSGAVVDADDAPSPVVVGEGMVGSVAGRARILWAILAVVFVLALALSTVFADAARKAAYDDVVQRARDEAQLLTDTISDKQLAKPVEGSSYEKLAAKVWTSASDQPIVGMSVWSSHARVLFSLNRSLVGTTSPEMQPLISTMSRGSGSYRIAGSTVRAFAPAYKATNGQVVLVEVDVPLAAATAEIGTFWSMVRFTLVFGLTVCLLLLGLSFVWSVRRTVASEGRRRRTRPETKERDEEPSLLEAATDDAREDEAREDEAQQVEAQETTVEAQETTVEARPSRPVTDVHGPSFAEALEALEAIQPDLEHAIKDQATHEGATEEVSTAEAVTTDAVTNAPTTGEPVPDEAHDGDAVAQELLRKRREEFKARAAKAELRFKKQDGQLQEAGSAPTSEQ